MFKQTCVLFFGIALALFLTSGCKTIQGVSEVNLDAPLEKSVKAAEKALNKLKFAAIAQNSDALMGKLTARTSQDDEIIINLNKVSETTTAITIQVGVLNDKKISQRILDEIKAILK